MSSLAAVVATGVLVLLAVIVIGGLVALLFISNWPGTTKTPSDLRRAGDEPDPVTARNHGGTTGLYF